MAGKLSSTNGEAVFNSPNSLSPDDFSLHSNSEKGNEVLPPPFKHPRREVLYKTATQLPQPDPPTDGVIVTDNDIVDLMNALPKLDDHVICNDLSAFKEINEDESDIHFVRELITDSTTESPKAGSSFSLDSPQYNQKAYGASSVDEEPGSSAAQISRTEYKDNVAKVRDFWVYHYKVNNYERDMYTSAKEIFSFFSSIHSESKIDYHQFCNISTGEVLLKTEVDGIKGIIFLATPKSRSATKAHKHGIEHANNSYLENEAPTAVQNYVSSINENYTEVETKALQTEPVDHTVGKQGTETNIDIFDPPNMTEAGSSGLHWCKSLKETGPCTVDYPISAKNLFSDAIQEEELESSGTNGTVKICSRPWIPIKQGNLRSPHSRARGEGKRKLKREELEMERKGKIRVFIESHYKIIQSGTDPSYEGINSVNIFQHFKNTPYDHGESFDTFNQKLVLIPGMTSITQRNKTVNYMVKPLSAEASLFYLREKNRSNDPEASKQMELTENADMSANRTESPDNPRSEVGETDKRAKTLRGERRNKVKEFWKKHYEPATVQEYISTQAAYKFYTLKEMLINLSSSLRQILVLISRNTV